MKASKIKLEKKRKVYLEGNILKLIETDNDEFAAYLQEAKEKDSETRKKRLEWLRESKSSTYGK